MSVSAITQPHIYMAAYSAVPLKVYSNEWDQQELFKYIVNVVWNTVSISADQSINIGNDVYTLLTSSTPHLFELGDTILLDDSINGGQFTGYYIVQKIISSTQFAIDLIPGVPFASPGFTCSNVLKWRLAPDLDGYGKIDLSNSLKDFVTQNLTGQTQNYGLTYGGPDTRFSYSIYCGSEKNYTFQFEDNILSGGTVAFYNSSITSLSGIPFQVGDVITVDQDVVEWPYTDNYFASDVGFTGTTQHSFLPGQQITITGQQTHPFYNGLSSILSVTANAFVINKGWQGSSPVEPGFAYGVPRPEYNNTCTIVSITVHPTYGVVINTDMPFTTASVDIPGIIQYADGQITEDPVELKLTGFSVYNAHIDNTDYSLTAYDPYVIQSRAVSGNNISTIFNQSNCYRIEPNTVGFLLSHTPPSGVTFNTGMAYEFFNSAGGTLGTVFLPKSVISQTDWYAPIGLQQIGQSPYTNFSGSFPSYSGSVASYNAYAYLATGTLTQISNKICFKLNTDCSMYEIYHLMWKDKYGSFISYPFIYMSRENIEVDRKTYYKQPGTWNNNSFQYDDYGNGEKQFYLKSRKSFILNSGWLYEFERTLIEDLMQSASVYLQTPDNRLFQAHLEPTDLEIFKNINEQLFSYTFNVRTSNNEYRF